MTENLAAQFKRALGVDVLRRDDRLVERLASKLTQTLGDELLPMIERRDARSFTDRIRTAVDQPGFDQALYRILGYAVEIGILEEDASDMLWAVAKNAAAEHQSDLPNGDVEEFVMFAVPVQGTSEDLARMFERDRDGGLLAELMKQTNFVSGRAEVGFLPKLFNPGDLAEAPPTALRHASASIGMALLSEDREERLQKAARSVASRVVLEEPSYHWHDDVTGTDIRYLVGGYYQAGPMKDMELDALLMAAGKYDDEPGHVAARTRAFFNAAEEKLGIRVGQPGLIPRVAADTAFIFVATSLLNSAGRQGLIPPETRRIEPDDMVYVEEDGALIVLAKMGDEVANSDPLPFSLVAGDIEHFRGHLRTIHPAARPLPNEIGHVPAASNPAP